MRERGGDGGAGMRWLDDRVRVWPWSCRECYVCVLSATCSRAALPGRQILKNFGALRAQANFESNFARYRSGPRDAGSLRQPSRREVGHGALERRLERGREKGRNLGLLGSTRYFRQRWRPFVINYRRSPGARSTVRVCSAPCRRGSGPFVSYPNSHSRRDDLSR